MSELVHAARDVFDSADGALLVADGADGLVGDFRMEDGVPQVEATFEDQPEEGTDQTLWLPLDAVTFDDGLAALLRIATAARVVSTWDYAGVLPHPARVRLLFADGLRITFTAQSNRGQITAEFEQTT